MNLYLAGIYTSGVRMDSQIVLRCGEAGHAARQGIRNYLESYHYINKPRMLAAIRKDNVKVFLDSGAFSAYSLGAEIDLDDYVEYIHTNKDIIRVDESGALLASVLDGIGDPKKTLDNQAAMESNGITPLPCYHYGEPESYLVHYLDEYEYITIGGLVPISTKEIIRWLDRIWRKYISTSDGQARIAIHAFGVTSIPIMARYPWASVDSSSWIANARNGNIFLPEKFTSMAISADSPMRKVQNQHIDTLPEPVRDDLIAKIEGAYGLSVEQMHYDYAPRWVHNMAAFGDLQDHITSTCQKFRSPVQELF